VKRIFIAEPKLAGNERKYVLDCLDSNWISSNGKYIEKFEKAFAEFCGVDHAVATSNGTAALHLCLVAMGLGPGDEVIVPAVTYIATANAVRYCGAKAVLAEVCDGTLNLSPTEIESKITSRTKGIIAVHLYGHPADMDPISEIANRHGLFVIEDAAEAHGAEYRGRRVGGLGDAAAFSFFGNKIVTTGEGGMVTTNDAALFEKLRLYRGQGVDPNRRYWHPVIGYNYRMTNIQAAIGVAQMETVDAALSYRRKVADWYDESLAPLRDEILLPTPSNLVSQAFWMYNIFLRKGDHSRRDAVMWELDKSGIETRPVFHPLHTMPPYLEATAYPIADTWAPRGINLPTHQSITRSDVQRVAESLAKAISNL
jgi:perosamine synthetase